MKKVTERQSLKMAVAYESEAVFLSAKLLAQSLDMPLDNTKMPQLLVTNDKIVLKMDDDVTLYADFNSKTWQKRRDAGKKQGLVSACKPRVGLRIIDATAGWGRDAAILASFGASVLMLERQPLMATLLADALLHRDLRSKEILNLSLCAVDAFEYLEVLPETQWPDVIYIDPMHPRRQKSAKVKKGMQALQQLFGPDEDSLALLKLACVRSRKRVVVKWPEYMAPLMRPVFSVRGKTVRFDCYHL